MLLEVEAKILQVDRNRIVQTLTGLGARKVFDGEIVTFFFDFSDGSIIKSQDLLRLRRENNKVELTFKKVQRNSEAKMAEEYTVEVSDLETAKKILELLGLSVTEEMSKHRVSYKLNNARFDMDKYSGKYSYIPEFLEIEADTPENIHKYAEFLGFTSDDCLPWSTQDLIDYYSSKKEK